MLTMSSVGPCLHVMFSFKNRALFFSLLSMNNEQSGSSSSLSVIEPVTIDTMINKNGPFLLLKTLCVNMAL